MPKARNNGDGGLYWSETRQRWIAEVTVGYTPAGKRITKKASGRTKTQAKNKLREYQRDLEDGLPIGPNGYTVADAVNAWLAYGRNGRAKKTIRNDRDNASLHVIPELGKRRLRELTAEDVDRFLAKKAAVLSTRSLRMLHSILKRSVDHAQARDKVKRNVVVLCQVPEGKREGRPSKALTFAQAEAVLVAAENSSIHAYVVVSLLTGARTEELRALTWSHVDLVGKPNAQPLVPPSIAVFRSERVRGDTKTKRSRRVLGLPRRCVNALHSHFDSQQKQRGKAGGRWREHDLVFASRVGTPLLAGNVRRAFRPVVKAAGLNENEWVPRELRHSFTSLLSDRGVPIEQIASLLGHSGSTVTETVYRHQIRPVLNDGAQIMDAIFDEAEEDEE